MIAKKILSVAAVIGLGIGPALAQTPPPPQPSTTITVLDAASGGCTLGVTPDARVRLGERVDVRNGSSSSATVFSRGGFWTVSLGVGVEKTIRVFGAGTYLSACVPGQWKAPLRARPVAPGSPPGNSFSVRWADPDTPGTWRFGVQYRIGQGTWRPWKSGTALHASTFSGSNGRTYFFRARTIRNGGSRSDWSPTRRVVT
jgi:hypothetical protein